VRFDAYAKVWALVMIRERRQAVRVSFTPETIRQMIRHEDDLRNQRLTWLFTLDGFLFATLGLVWSGQHSTLLIFALAAVGVFIGLSAVGSMSVSKKAIDELRCESNPDSERVMGIEQTRVGRGTKLLYPWYVMPWVMVVIWPAIAVIHAVQFR
jgi:hypothetical protein